MHKITYFLGSGCLFGEFLQLFSQHPHSADIFDLVQEYENVSKYNKQVWILRQKVA